MDAKRFGFTITGTSPLLLHADNIDWSDRLEAWRKDPQNKRQSRAGDDRSPAFTWIGYLPNDGTRVALPWDMLMPCLRGAAAQVSAGTGRKTLKGASVALMDFENDWHPVTVSGREVLMASLMDLMAEPEIVKHRERAESLGFQLFTKRAKIGTSKHIRVRPMFVNWECSGVISVVDHTLAKALPDIFDIAGRLIGLGDWRPSSGSPGRYGKFSAVVTEIGGAS